jgi:hypothetical protein
MCTKNVTIHPAPEAGETERYKKTANLLKTEDRHADPIDGKKFQAVQFY